MKSLMKNRNCETSGSKARPGLKRLLMATAAAFSIPCLALSSSPPPTSDTPPMQMKERKYVFAHYMVCIPTYGPSSKVEDYQREIRTAQANGIDGFALNCGNWTVKEAYYKKRVLQIYQAAAELGTDFKLMISADFATGLEDREVKDMVDSFRNHPNQFTYQGRPVLSTFAGNRRIADYLRAQFQGDQAICFVPFFYPSPAKEMPEQPQIDQVYDKHHDVVDGFFHFGAAGTTDEIVRSNRELAAKWIGNGKLFMGSVTPHYRGPGPKYNNRVFEMGGIEGYARQWEGCIASDANWVEIVTWNDWGERSHVSTFGELSSTNNVWGSRLSHEGFLRAGRYYASWFKQGVPPVVERDEIFYSYQLHPKDAAPPETAPSGAALLADKVYATAFVKEPAALEVNGVRFDLSTSGVHHVSVPMQMGPQRFKLIRDDKIVLDKTGEFEIGAKPDIGNYDVFSGGTGL